MGGSRFHQYLPYALGEILLIVVGILLALSINNLQEEWESREKERAYLSGLQKEFERNRAKLNELSRVNRSNYESALRLLAMTYDDRANPSEEELSTLLYEAFAYDISYSPNNALLNEILYSGSLRVLSNDELRLQLTNWSAVLADIRRQEAELRLQRDKVVDLIRNPKYSLRTILEGSGIREALDLPQGKITTSNRMLLRSGEFENNLLLFILSAQATEREHYAHLRKVIESILRSIEKELAR